MRDADFCAGAELQGKRERAERCRERCRAEASGVSWSIHDLDYIAAQLRAGEKRQRTAAVQNLAD